METASIVAMLICGRRDIMGSVLSCIGSRGARGRR
jgi:hypothetical protein